MAVNHIKINLLALGRNGAGQELFDVMICDIFLIDKYIAVKYCFIRITAFYIDFIMLQVSIIFRYSLGGIHMNYRIKSSGI